MAGAQKINAKLHHYQVRLLLLLLLKWNTML